MPAPEPHLFEAILKAQPSLFQWLPAFYSNFKQLIPVHEAFDEATEASLTPAHWPGS